MSAIFVDTWAWYALVDAADSDHPLAQIANEELLNRGHTFVTTNLIVAEALALIRYHLHHAAALSPDVAATDRFRLVTTGADQRRARGRSMDDLCAVR
jgi:predicted nucleic acid-binding protein